MALFNAHRGSWFGLPDFGISERLTGNRTSQGGSDIIPNRSSNRSSAQSFTPVTPTFTASNLGSNNQTSDRSSGDVLGTSNTGGGGRSGGGVRQGDAGAVTGGGDSGGGGGGGGGQPSGPSEQELIEQAFQGAQSELGGIESRAQGAAQSAEAQLRSEADVSREQLGRERGARVSELQGRETDIRQDRQQASGRIKSFLNDLSNRNAAFLASRGGGAFESSLGQALGERLGRAGAQELGELQTQTQQALRGVAEETERVKNFFTTAEENIDTQLQQGLMQVQSQLQNKLDQVSQLKAENAQQKALRTMDAWNRYAQQVQQVRAQAFSAQNALQNWALEKGKTLEQAQQFALQGTPNVTPENFGVVRPDQGLAGNVGQQQPNFGAPRSGVQVNLAGAGGQQDEDDLSQFSSLLSANV